MLKFNNGSKMSNFTLPKYNKVKLRQKINIIKLSVIDIQILVFYA